MPSTKTFLERSPFYAFLGAADVALETVRSSFDTAAASAVNFRDDFTPEQLQERILDTVNDVREQIAALPALATEQYELVSDNVQRAYEEFVQGYLEFAERGVELTREATVQGISAVAAAREAAREASDSTFAAVLDARKETAKGVERFAGLAGRGADVVESEAETVVRSAAAKQGAAKRASSKPAAKKATKKTSAAKPAATKAPAKKAAVKKAAPAKKTAAAKQAAPAKKAPVTAADKPANPAKQAPVKAADKPAAPEKSAAAPAPTLPVDAKVEVKVETSDNA